MYGYEIIQELRAFLTGEEIIVSSNGNISRQVYHYLPKPQIYLRGSMGLPISVGLGLSLARPDRKVLSIVGDGNLLMGMSSLTTASFVHPKNLRILILDNNSYATTGNQKTTSGILDYPALLDGFGLPNIVPILGEDSLNDVHEKIGLWFNAPDLCVLPSIVDAKPPKLDNIPLHPEEITTQIKDRFQ